MHLNYSWKIITKFHFSSFFHFSPARPKIALKNRLGPAARPGQQRALQRPKTAPSPRVSPRPHPGRNLGLGRQSASAAHTRLGLDLAQRISGVRSDPTAERPFRTDQKRRRGRRPGNPRHSALPLSLSSLLFSSQPQRRRPPPSSRERGKAERSLAPSLAPSPARVLPNG